MNEVRIGLIGVGGMGSSHGRYLQEGRVRRARLTAVCDGDPARLADWPDPIRRFTDSRALIRSGAVDAVLIATPHFSHTSIGIDAFRRGLHVLVEKPISVHKADAERLIAARRGRPTVFAAMFQMRTAPQYVRLRELVRGGELGTLQRVVWTATDWYRTQAYYASGGWRATWAGEGGGVLLNQCPHILDQLVWIAGMPSRVRAYCAFGRHHPIEVEDDVTAYLEFPGGATGLFVCSTGEAPGINRVEFSGTRGRLVFEDGRLRFFRNTVPSDEFLLTSKGMWAKPETWTIEIPIPGGPGGGRHDLIAQNFVDAILDGAPLIAPGEEGLASVELANAMLLSTFLDRAVDIPISGAQYARHLARRIAGSRAARTARRRTKRN